MVSLRLAAGVFPNVLKMERCEKSVGELDAEHFIGPHARFENNARNIFEGLACRCEIGDFLFQRNDPNVSRLVGGLQQSP
jgi:hypothetical protein